MNARNKGRLVGAATAIAIGIVWANADLYVSHSSPSCWGHDGDPFWWIAIAMLAPAVPLAIWIGRVIGAVAGHLRRYRHAAIASLGLSVAAFLSLLASGIDHGPSEYHDPFVIALMSRSLPITLLAALVLERWTRPPPPLAPAIARGTRCRPRPPTRG
jgi:hypothetical protein